MKSSFGMRDGAQDSEVLTFRGLGVFRGPRRLIYIAALCASFAAIFWFTIKPAAPLEVLSTDLQLRDGRLYHGGQTRPFTGVMIDRHAGNILKSRSEIRDGRLHGLSEGWHTNGQLQVRESFKKGLSHGLRIKWSEQGVKLAESSIVEGKLDGPFRRWHENGALAEEVTMNAGEPDGLARAFYPSGFLKTEARLKNGKIVEQKSWADGEMKGGATVLPPTGSQSNR